MGGICERPGCNEGASAAIAADPRNLIVWVGDLEGSADAVNRLCARHADTLVAPVGWERRDVRDTPRLFALPGAAKPARRRSRRRNPLDDNPGGGGAPRSEPLLPVERPTAAAAPAPMATTVAGARTEPTMQAPPSHLGDLHRGDARLSADTDALLAVGAGSPLLARAFRTARAG